MADLPNFATHRNNNSPIFNSFAMDCQKNTYAPDGGKPMHQIVDEMAEDNEVFADKFLEGWGKMISTGYSDLTVGPVSGWLGHYSLVKQVQSKRKSTKRLIVIQ